MKFWNIVFPWWQHRKGDTRERQELKLERWLGNKRVIAGILIAEDILLWFAINYIINFIMNIGSLLQDLDNPEKYIGLRNFVPGRNLVSHPHAFLAGYAIYILLCAVFDIRQAYRMRASYSDEGFNLNQKGYARWATDDEIMEQYTKIPDRDKAFDGYGGIVISRMGKNLYIDTDMVNNLIIGITRSGKGEMEVIPSIDVYSRAREKTSLVICDPKTELYKTSKRTLEDRGYDVHLLSLVDPEHSMGFNPLEQIKTLYLDGDYANAELLAQSFSYSIFNPDKTTGGDTFWQDTPSSLLTALILAHLEDCYEQSKADHKDYMKKCNMYSIINTFGELVAQQDPETPYITGLDLYFNKRPALNRAKLKYMGIEVAGVRTKSSIYASMMAKLSVFTYENIAKMTAESTLNLEDIGFGEKPVAVFLEIPDYDKSTHFLASVFIRQLYFVLARRATRKPSGKCDRRVKVIADEFGNIPAIESMENIMTVCLGRNISFDLYIQAYSQLTKLYGENSKTITGNCGNTIYILSDDDETTKKFSDNLGSETIIDLQRSGGRLSSKKNLTESTLEKPLLNMNQLEELRPGECVVKRVMKRTDLRGRRITPHPIFNSEESGRRFLFRYEYLTKTFPNPDQIDLKDVNTEDRSHIILKERVWDYKMTFMRLNFENAGEDKSKLRVGDLPGLIAKMPEIENALGEPIGKDLAVDRLEVKLTTAGLPEDQLQTFLNAIGIAKKSVGQAGGKELETHAEK